MRFEAADQPLVVQVAELEDSTMVKTQEAMSAQEEIEVAAGCVGCCSWCVGCCSWYVGCCVGCCSWCVGAGFKGEFKGYKA